MSINLKWDAFAEGLQVSFDAESDHHRSVLPWSEIERLRSEMEANLLANIPKQKAGIATGPSVIPEGAWDDEKRDPRD